MATDLETLWDGATFMPHGDQSRTDLVLERVRKSRQARFLAFGLNLMVKAPALYEDTRFADVLAGFKNLSHDTRSELVEYPLFMIWLKESHRALSSPTDLKSRLADYPRVIAAFESRGTAAHTLRSKGRSVDIVRFEIDPLLAKVAAPEYRLPSPSRQREFEKRVAYPTLFFVELLSLALKRMEQTWPEAHRDFFAFVRVVVDMIDGEATSLSAADHTGVIFVSTDNSPLIALEEYLIHEFGHQILYYVMEIDPLVRPDVQGTYALPWSGQKRDFYGYFHAFFIYILMANYYRRMEARSAREQQRSVNRVAHIVKGLVAAVPPLQAAGGFTPKGQRLFDNLKTEVSEIESGVRP